MGGIEPEMERPGAKGQRSRRWIAAGTLALGVAVAVALRVRGGLDFDPESLRAWIEAQGWRAPFVFVLAAGFRIFLLLPSWVVMSAGGLLFGVVGGTLLGTLGFTAGGLLAFGLARGLGRDAVAGRLRGGLARFDGALRRHGARWLALYTAMPITPLTPAHGAAGLSGISWLAFAGAVAAGMLPRTLLFSYFGDRLATGDLEQVALACVVVLGVAWLGLRLGRRLAGAGRGGDRGEGA